jgi:hypothetical protein
MSNPGTGTRSDNERRERTLIYWILAFARMTAVFRTTVLFCFSSVPSVTVFGYHTAYASGKLLLSCWPAHTAGNSMVQGHSGKVIAVLFFLGGAAVIGSLLHPVVNMPLLLGGAFLLLVALILLILALRRI